MLQQHPIVMSSVYIDRAINSLNELENSDEFNDVITKLLYCKTYLSISSCVMKEKLEG